MGITDTFHLEWPDLDDSADGPAALEEIATETDTRCGVSRVARSATAQRLTRAA